MRSPFVAAVAVAVALTGCSAAGGGHTTPIAAIQLAYTKTMTARTVRVDITNTFSTGPGKPTQMTTETGFIDFANHRSTLTESGPNGVTLERRFIGTYIYFRLTALGAKPWVKADLSNLGGSNLVLAQLSLLRQTADPATGLDYLKAASTKVDFIGNDNVAGTTTRHYRATIDPQRAAAAAQVGPAKGAQLQPVIEVWIDGSGHARQLSYELSGTPSGVKLETFSDFGVSVDIAVPPADQITVLGS